MKKRILSILLTLCMTLCLTPISVFAEEVGTEGSAAIQLGTDALSVLSKNVNTATAPTVYFGQNHENNPTAWRVIGYDGSGVTSSKGDITLLAAGAMGVIPFVDTILNNEYAPSNLKTAIDALAEKLTTEENAAVKKRTLTSGSYDGENTDCVAGGQVDNAVFWPLSAKEAIAVNNDLRALNPAHPNWVDSGWWLRSPGSDKYRLAVVRSEGSVQYSGFSVLIFNNHRTVRPAFNLNLNSVLFASAAVGGKPDGGLAEVSKYSGNEWKLTLLDSRRNFAVTEKTVSAAPDDTVTLNYKGATTGKNEYISVILADNNGAQYYGRVAQPTAKSGTVEIKIPSDIAPGDYTMKVFSEQYNGDCKTDLASAFADVTLTVESQPDEQFTLAPGGRYYFDLSAMNIPGTVNSNLPDSTLHYVPFTYVGTVNAYKLTSEMATTEEYAQKNKYPHSLFIADYAVTHTVSWDDLNTAGLIFGKDYATGGVNYTLRAPSVGSDNRGSGDSERGTPQSNEWDRILDKDSGYIKNWNGIYSWGQDTTRYNSSLRAIRGYDSGRRWNDDDATDFLPLVSFRPVLEILNPDTLSSDGLKVVTLDLGGGTLGGSSEDIQIIVKSSESFAAPASDGMTRPDGNTGSYFKWLGSDGNLYAPGDNVPAVVTRLTAQFDSSSHSVTITFNGNGGTGTMDSVTVKAGANYTLPACGFTEPEGKQFKGWSTSADGSVISGTTYEVSSDTTFYAIWESKEYSIIVTDGKATIGAGSEISKAAQGTTITLTANAAPDGKVFDKWVVESGSATLEDANSETTTFIMPDSEVSVKATYKNAPVTTYSLTTQVNGGHGTISASKTGLTEGSTETVTFTPDDGYEIDLVTVNGVVTDVLSNILNVTMDADKTVIVTYKAIPHTHTYDQEIQKPETLKSAADCTNDAVYFKSCSCGEISTTETFTAAGTQLGHAWASDWSKDTDNHWKECSRCHEKKDEAAHDYGSDNICDTCGYDKTVPHTHNLTLVPAKAPTCTEKGNTAYYTCDGCDKWFEDATGASEITDKTSVILAATGHSASDWKSDNTDHWKECTVVGCGVIIEGSKAAHTAGEWIIDTPATATTDGSKHKECTVCGYTMTIETIPATGGGEHTHSYGSEWKNDADNHWHECSCGDKADKAAHDFKWVVDKEATATQKGSKHEECKVCGYKKAAVEILATGSTTKPTDPTQTNSNTGAEGPKTGDNSNMILWIALLFISGGAVIGITVYSKKKKENAE